MSLLREQRRGSKETGYRNSYLHSPDGLEVGLQPPYPRRLSRVGDA
jgi:hypothetical protein